MDRTNRARILATAVPTILATFAGFSLASTVGPSPDFGGSLDSAGTRLNIDLTDPMFLQAGTYTVNNFDFNSGSTSGDAQPFLATQSGGVFTVIAAGSDQTVTATGQTSTSFGAATFVVPAGGQTVYAGFNNEAGPNPIVFQGSGSTNHNNPGVSGGVTNGQTFSSFTVAGLGRSYAFSISMNNAANLVTNGSFEDPNLGANGFREGNPATGWTEIGSGSSGGGIVGNGSAYGNPIAPDGVQAGLLKNGGGMSQLISGLVAGQEYELNFQSAGRDFGGGANPFVVSIGTQNLLSVTPALNQYASYTADFVATGTSETLEFLSSANSDISSYVDDVSIVLVPEPASLSLLGVATLGLLARRRRA